MSLEWIRGSDNADLHFMNLEWMKGSDSTGIPHTDAITEFLKKYIINMEFNKNPYLKNLGKKQELYIYLYPQPTGPAVREDHGHELRQYTIQMRGLYSTPEMVDYDLGNIGGTDVGVFEILEIRKGGVKKFEMVKFRPEICALKDKKDKTPSNVEEILICDPNLYDRVTGFEIDRFDNNMAPFNEY